jgi:hypothetical protein
MSASLHIPTLAHRIVEHIRAEQLPPGTRLPGRKLARSAEGVAYRLSTVCGSVSWYSSNRPKALSDDFIGARTVTSSTLAVFRLIIRSSFVDGSTGRPAAGSGKDVV